MKTLITIILIGIWLTPIFSQIPEKEMIMEGYYVGHKAYKAIETNNTKLLPIYFADTTNLKAVQTAINSMSSDHSDMKIIKDLMYNQQTKNYEFVAYAGKYIPAKDGWGFTITCLQFN